MIKKLLVLALAACMTVSVCSCSIPFVDQQEEAFPVTMGHTKLDSAVKSVVVLDDNTADILIASGYTDKIVGRSNECSQLEISTVQCVGPAASPDIDSIATINPDLVLADDSITAESAVKLEEKNVNLLRIALASDDTYLTFLYEKMCSLFDGNITGKQNGDQAVNTVITKMQEAKDSNKDTATVATACYLFDLNGSAVTGDMFGSEILSSAGAIDICADVTGGKLLNETLVAQNPNYIFCAEGLRSQIVSNDAYKNITAVKKSRVYEIPAADMTRQGATINSAIKKIHDIIYSENKGANKSVAADYKITLTEDMTYTVDEEDDNVMAIQKRLDNLGYLTVEPTGYFGESTATAVAEFQEANSLDRQDGVADYTTLAMLFSTNAVERSTPAR